MCDPVDAFESVLKKQSLKKPIKLYSDCKQETYNTIKPQDVISSVFSQLKAIQVADSVKNSKSEKNINNYKKSSFLSVNNLPVYQEVHKPAANFDTQCVTDTELINIIENAEILDHHTGITQEFDNTFCHTDINIDKDDSTKKVHVITSVNHQPNDLREKYTNESSENKYKHINIDGSIGNGEIQLDKDVDITEDNKDTNNDMEQFSESLFGEESIREYKKQSNHLPNIEQPPNISNKAIVDNQVEVENNDNFIKHLPKQSDNLVQTNLITIPKQHNLDKNEEVLPTGTQEELYSQILKCNNVKNLNKNIKITQVQENVQKLKQCIKAKDNNSISTYESLNQSIILQETDKERSPSPVFKNIKVTRTSKTPSPLIFNLDKFENFECIAAPILEINNDLKTAKMVINSQILDGELQINIEQEVNFKNREVLSPVLHDMKETNKGDPTTLNESGDKSFIKATAKILSKVTNEFHANTEGTVNQSHILKDEILFSSDEEVDNVNEIQDLPLTCALETSFYDQSDILDKTMFMGFQTASNRSIQVCKKSFSKAISLLDDLHDEGPSITELVKHCDVKGKPDNNLEVDETSKQDQKENNISVNKLLVNNNQSNINRSSSVVAGNSNKPAAILKTSVSEGFTTASNKVIAISPKSLARCKKVFQDINLDEQYDTHTEVKNELKNFDGFKTASDKKIKLSDKALAKCKEIFQDIDLNTNYDDDVIEIEPNVDIEIEHTKLNVGIPKDNPKEEVHNIIDDTQNFDDVLLQELEYVEMSLQEQKQVDIHILPHGFKTASDKNIKISDNAVAKTNIFFKDIEYNENGLQDPEKLIKSYKISDDFGNFKTPCNKNIRISKDGRIPRMMGPPSMSDKQCEDINFTKFPKKSLEEINMDYYGPRTSNQSFVGFKTANNKNIQISKKALAKVQDIFKNIDDDLKISKNSSKEYPDLDNEPSTSKQNSTEVEHFSKLNADINNSVIENLNNVDFVGFKTARNTKINISEKALANARNVFKSIDTADSTIPIKDKKDYPEINDQPDADITSNKNKIAQDVQLPQFHDFKTASNKKVNITKESLEKCKNIFDNIDLEEFTLPTRENSSKIDTVMSNTENKPHNKTNFKGFQTASNKKVTVSEKALAKTKIIFKDIDTPDTENPNFTRLDKQTKDEKSNFKSDDKIIAIHKPPITKGFIGFQTASNKKVNISKEALAKTRNIFNDIDSPEFIFCNKDKNSQKVVDTIGNDVLDINQPSTSKTSIVDTEKVKNIPVPKSTLVKLKDKLQGTDARGGLYQLSSTKPSFGGFKTANNKNIQISEAALLKTRNVFKEIETTDLPVKSKKDYPDIDADLNNVLADDKKIDTPKFQGFQTASNKKVKISDDALAKTKNIFKDIDTYNDLNDFNKDLEKDPYIYKETSDKTSPIFKGFSTASNKKVIVNEEALAKSKKLFQDAEAGNNKDKNDAISNKKSSVNFAFKSGNNKNIVISEDAILKTKRRFSDIDDKNIISNKSKRDKKQFDDKEEIINNIIDTQVLNNFDESLHTEDFHETPAESKRSGSPILSCPRAKKRKKFEIPYSQKKVKNKIEIEEKTSTKTNKITFDSTYKTNKKYKLKDLVKITDNINSTIDPYLLRFNFDNLLDFKFHGNRNELSQTEITVATLKDLFVSSVNMKLVPNGWLDNHLRLIIWKLISYEVKFNSAIVCSVRNVLEQLKYRYDVELYDARRPPLRKIMEKDDVASKTMVLCVAGVFVDGVRVISIPNTSSNIELLLTDGWYTIRACIDRMLEKLVCDGKINVGSKIVTTGAELVNCEQGVSPWEDTSAIRLKIFGNSTRRARWDARLGYHSNTAVLSRLSSLNLGGGKVSKCRLFVTRVYPSLYVHKFEDGSTVTRSERLEHMYQAKMETNRQAMMERIYDEVQKEFADQDSQDSEGLSDSGSKRGCLDSGSQIAKVLKRSKEPGEIKAQLTSTQTRLLEQHTMKRREDLLQNIQKRIQEKMEKEGVCNRDNVVTLLKIRVADVTENGAVCKGMMSIWRPTDAVIEIIKEGAWIDVMNVIPTAVRYSEIQLSASRQTIFSTSKFKETDKIKPYINLLRRKCYTIKELTQNPQMTTDYDEIDTVGLIFLIDPSIQEFESKKPQFQNMYLTDPDKNMICINFWGGLKKFGFENILDTGQMIVCGNLQKRIGNTRKSIPQYRVTDFSYFTKSPRNEGARGILDDLNKKFMSLDRRKFFVDCVVLRNNYSVFKHNNENISPYRSNNIDINKSSNKIFIDSPLIPKHIDDKFNLTGLDFESSFKQTDGLSEEIVQRKKKVNEKIAKLKMYGEPPPLSPLHIINKSRNATKSYKSPLISNNNDSKPHTNKVLNLNNNRYTSNSKSDTSISVANLEKTPQKCGNIDDLETCSPVLNKNYVKSVNPVKLNFDANDDSNVDHFADEFDGSPPLSLD